MILLKGMKNKCGKIFTAFYFADGGFLFYLFANKANEFYVPPTENTIPGGK